MGISASNAIVKNTINSLTSVVNTTVSDVVNNVETNCNTQNIFEGFVGIYPTSISPDGTIMTAPCTPPANISNFILNQIGSNTCNITGGITQNINSQITNELATNIKTWLESNAKANNGFLGFGISIANSQNISTIELSQRIANTLTSNLSDKCSSVLNASNLAKIYYCGEYPNGIAVTQSAVNTNLTSCIINNVITSINDDRVLNDIVVEALADAEASNQGVGSLFAPLRWLIIGIVILGALIIIGIVLYLLFGGSKTAVKPEQLASFVNPEVRRCAMRARVQLEEEGKAGDRKAEKFLIERCLSESQAQRRFSDRPESYEMQEMGGSREFRERD